MGWEQHLDKWRKIIYYYGDRPIVLGKGTGILERTPEEKSEADNVFGRPAFDLRASLTRVWPLAACKASAEQNS
jgi:hypothetical protein